MSFESIQSARSAREGASSHRVVCAALGAAALSLLAATAQAKDSHFDDKVAVNYADLDLSKASDTKALYSRLRNASDKVCGWHDVRDIRGRMQHQICFDTALAEAVANVDHAALTQLHDDVQRIRVAQGR